MSYLMSEIKHKELTIYIVTGGKSSRMGYDKATAILNEKSFLTLNELNMSDVLPQYVKQIRCQLCGTGDPVKRD